jgi:phage shock protein C
MRHRFSPRPLDPGQSFVRPTATDLRQIKSVDKMLTQYESIEEDTMLLTEELNKLHEMHQRGVLSDEEFLRAKTRLLDSTLPTGNDPPLQALDSLNALRRSRSNRWIAGVCGGIAASTGMESWLARLLFAALFTLGGAGLLVYLLLWFFVPSD